MTAPAGLRRAAWRGCLQVGLLCLALAALEALAPTPLAAKGSAKPGKPPPAAPGKPPAKVEEGPGWRTLPPPAPAVVQSLLAGLTSTDAAARRRAGQELTALGPSALRPLLRELPLSGGEDVERTLLEALEALGRDVALARLLAERSHYAYRYEKEVGALLAALRRRRDPALTAGSALSPGTLSDPDLLPPLAVRHVESELVVPGLAEPRFVRPAGADLTLDLKGDGAFSTRVRAGKPQVLALETPTGPRRLLVFKRLERWLQGPADLGTATLWGARIEVLDADGDGGFVGPHDLVRFGDGAFRPVADGPLGWTGEAILRFSLRQDGATARVEGSLDPFPREASASVREAWLLLNTWRNGLGLLPKHLDIPHSEQAQLHAEYCRIHGVVSHDEQRGLEGFSEEGAEAGISSTVWPGTPAHAVDVVTSTIVHRHTLLTAWHEGFGVGAAGTSVLWGGRSDTSTARYPVVVPGPGRRDVPHPLRAELPDPQGRPGFYTTPRGYPITVLWDRHVDAWREPRLELWALGAKPTSLPGTLFAPGASYLERDPTNSSMLVFVPDLPLAPKQDHVARVTATRDGKPILFEWAFRTR